MGKNRSHRKLPVTAIAISLSLVLIGVIWLVAQNTHSDKPTTLAGVRSEVLTAFDAIQIGLPASDVLDSVDAETVGPCADGSGGEHVEIIRSTTMADSFDGAGWLSELSASYDATGDWYVNTQTVGTQDHLRIKLVDNSLLIYEVEWSPRVEGAQLTISSDSRCTVRP